MPGHLTPREPDSRTDLADTVADEAMKAARSDSAKAMVYKAISVQRPVVVEYLKALRRSAPDATPEQLIRLMEKRYQATVTSTGAGVGMVAAIPAVGTGSAIALGVGDLALLYEASALHVLGIAELHGIEVHDAERARPLVFGMLMGEKSQSKVAEFVLRAAGAGAAVDARATANAAIKKALPHGWGTVVTQQLPDAALDPLNVLLAREALKLGARMTGRTVGKVLPFGIGAVIGGVGSFTFGRDVVRATHLAFPDAPTRFPAWLDTYEPSALDAVRTSPALLALTSSTAAAPRVARQAAGSAGAAARRGASTVGGIARAGAERASSLVTRGRTGRGGDREQQPE